MINVLHFADLSQEYYSKILPWNDYEVLSLAALAQFMDCREELGAIAARPTDYYISPWAVVAPDVIIGAGAQIHEFSTVRSGSIVGEDVVVGFGCEVSRSILARSCSLTHRTTVCSSIVGRGAHLGAGVVIANTHLFDENMRSPMRPITVQDQHGNPSTLEVARFGALIGDGVRIGMGAMLGPGTLIGRESVVYPGIVIGNETVGAQMVLKRVGEQYRVLELKHEVNVL
jgi:NDP-sugar pyrophosphorylase family protein